MPSWFGSDDAQPDQADPVKSGQTERKTMIGNIDNATVETFPEDELKGSYDQYVADQAAYYMGRQFPSQQSIYSRNSFATTDPVMKRFGIRPAQDGVMEFIPQPNLNNMDHLFQQKMQQPTKHNMITQNFAMMEDEYKKEFLQPAHFFEGVPNDVTKRTMFLRLWRQATERFYAYA